MKMPFSVVAKPAGAACNLDCSYCFFLSKELLYDHDSQRMSAGALRNYVKNFLDAQPDGPVTMIWQGGEPTLRGIDFFRQAVELGRELARPTQQVSHSLQTNGTLLNDEWGVFLAEEKFLVGLSVDGPANLHDAYRVNKGGRGSHSMVMRGWEVLRRHGVETNILCTVHAANAGHALEVYHFFRDEMGAKFLQFIPIVERVQRAGSRSTAQGRAAGNRGSNRELYRQHGADVTSRSVTPRGWGQFLSTIFEEWVTKDVGSVFVQTFDTLLSNRFGVYTMCVHAPQCGNGLALMHNGDVYSCDHYVEPEYLLGNISQASFDSMLASPLQGDFGRAKRTALPDQCLTCPVRWACHGGCPKDRFMRTDDGQDGLNYLCEGYSSFFSAAQPAIEAMGLLIQNQRPVAAVMKPAWQARLSRH